MWDLLIHEDWKFQCLNYSKLPLLDTNVGPGLKLSQQYECVSILIPWNYDLLLHHGWIFSCLGVPPNRRLSSEKWEWFIPLMPWLKVIPMRFSYNCSSSIFLLKVSSHFFSEYSLGIENLVSFFQYLNMHI